MFWPISPVVPELTGEDVHVWSASPAVGGEQRSRLFALLTPEEQQRAARYLHQLSKEQYVVARGLLRILLGRYLDLAPTNVRFTSGPQGKPFLASASVGLHFNISHTNGMILLAFTRSGQVGVDVE